MNHRRSQKTVMTSLLAFSIALTLACGYTAKTTPPAPGNIPAISQLTPNSAAAGDAAFTIMVDGSKFNSDAVVNFGGVKEITHFSSSGEITADIPASAVATAGTVKVTVTNPGKAGTGQYGSGGTQSETSTPMDFIVN